MSLLHTPQWLRQLLSRRARADNTDADFRVQKSLIEEQFGAWTAHNCQLGEGLWTLRPGSVNFDEKTRRCVRIAQDFFGSNLAGLQALDLGAGEGGLSLEFAAQGAKVVCIEGRAMNIAKAQFAASALGLRIDFRCHDVRLLSQDQSYDLVLCFGLLYHLDAKSAVRLIETIGRVTKRLLILDTHFSLSPADSIEFDGRTYRGHEVREHSAETTANAKAMTPWASLDNNTSFWLSKPSILNLLSRVGFSTVYEVSAPLVYDYWDRQTGDLVRYRDRSTLVAAKSIGTPILTTPAVNLQESRRVPENIDELLVTWPPRSGEAGPNSLSEPRKT